jgi:hypothetical protein
MLQGFPVLAAPGYKTGAGGCLWDDEGGLNVTESLKIGLYLPLIPVRAIRPGLLRFLGVLFRCMRHG